MDNDQKKSSGIEIANTINIHEQVIKRTPKNVPPLCNTDSVLFLVNISLTKKGILEKRSNGILLPKLF